MPPKKKLAVAAQAAGSSRGASRGRGAASTRARGGRGAASTRARGGRGASSARGGGRGAADDDMSNTFLGKLVENPAMLPGFLKFFGNLDKALEKRDKKRTAQRLGLGGDDDDDDDEEEEDSDAEGSSDAESVGDDVEGYAFRALAGMAAQMGGVSDLRMPGGARSDATSDEDESDDEDETDELMHLMTSEEESSDDEAMPEATGAQALPGASAAAGSSSTSQAPGARIKYVRFRDEEFAAAVAAAPRIARLSLAKLVRTRKDGMFGDAKPDPHIEAVLKALGGGTKNVAALHLEDAEWATSKKYSPLLVRLLTNYKQSLRTLALTNRLLLQPNNKQSNCIWKVVCSMPQLEELRLTYVSLSLHYYTYRGELRTEPAWPGAKPAKPALAALKRVHLYLTPDWFERQFHAAIDGGSDYDDFEYENVGGGEREEEQEDFLEHLLRYKGDAVTVLDMTCVMKTEMHLEIVDLLASLHNVRTVCLRVELLAVTKDMAALADATVAFHHDPAPDDAAVAEAAALIAAAPASWTGLAVLRLAVPSKAAATSIFGRAAPKRARQVQPSWNQVLTAVASTCRKLESLTLQGDGWDADALHQVLSSNPSLRTLELDESAALQPRLLVLLKDMASLQRVQLHPALRDAKEGTELAGPVAQCLQEWARRGVSVQWGKQPAA